ALTRQVVSGVLDRAVRAPEVVVEEEVLVGDDLPRRVQQQCGCVQVVVSAGGGTHVPAEADQDCAEARRLLAQRLVAARGQGNPHGSSSRLWAVCMVTDFNADCSAMVHTIAQHLKYCRRMHPQRAGPAATKARGLTCSLM